MIFSDVGWDNAGVKIVVAVLAFVGAVAWAVLKSFWKK